ncbi:MAG TPA: shikimate kinase [Lacipirellulaceae bacterium]|jgi:shikimate kinase|nr:shikimate kinase [Lacipirellulaceae bacterium]
MNRNDAPIFLIGYRGTGKTSVASELADRLNFEWVDADAAVEERAGKTIAQIFSEDGEITFREMEAEIVVELSGKRRTVIALGGGGVLREANRRTIRAAGRIVWLTAGVDSILERLSADATTAIRRPNLTSAGGRTEIEQLLAERTPLYRECATLIVDTEGKSAGEVADEIAAEL